MAMDLEGPALELKHDLDELRNLLEAAVRPNVRQILATEISAVQAKLASEEQKAQSIPASLPVEEKGSSVYSTKITSYGWDQSTKFVKLYVTLPGVEKLPAEQISCEFGVSSLKFTVLNLNGKNHVLQFIKLCHEIIPEESTYKVRSGDVVVSLKKAANGRSWSHLTEAERKAKESQDAKYDSAKDTAGEDPSSSIMNLMKKMYDEGDDDMKRMIKKTWYESQQKQGGSGALPGF